MSNIKQRKPDRCTTYTINTIKDVLLELLKKETFDKITVSNICRQAKITRTTFYLHFSNITDVLDELLKYALQVGEKNSNHDKDNIISTLTKKEYLEKIQKKWYITSSVPTHYKFVKISSIIQSGLNNLK